LLFPSLSAANAVIANQANVEYSINDSFKISRIEHSVLSNTYRYPECSQFPDENRAITITLASFSSS